MGDCMEKSCGCIIFNNDKVLIIKQLSGIYGFPKGHIEDGESEVMTAIRETKEEVGLDVNVNSKLRFTISYSLSNNIIKEVVYFVSFLKGDSNITIQEDEVDSYFWVNIKDVYDLLSFDNLKQLWLEVLKKYNEVYNG